MLVALGLGSVGYVGNFLACAFAVEEAGGTIPPMIIGIVPVAMAAIGNRGADGIPWRRLAPSLTFIVAGVSLVNAWRFAATGGAQDRAHLVLGVLWAFVGLVIWVAYGVVNSRAMRSGAALDTYQWTGLQGIGAGLGATLLWVLSASADPPAGQALLASSNTEWVGFVIWAIVLGLAGSWGATLCWTVASRRLPLAFAAQLVVSETVFGLIYGFAYEARWPSIVEMLSIALELIGVAIAIQIFTSDLCKPK